MANRHPDAGPTGGRKDSKKGSRRSLPPDTALSWEAQQEALKLVPGLPLIPRAPSVSPPRQPGSVPPPPSAASPFDESDESHEAIITSSFRAPEDQPLAGVGMRTEFSQQGVLIADLLRMTFAKRRYGAPRYRLRIDEPEGPSTGAGRLARQPLSLVSRRAPGPAIVCGWVDVAQKEAQVRSYGVVVQRYESRHGHAPQLSEEEYGRFLDKLMDTLFDGGFQIVHLVSDEEAFRRARKGGRWLRRSSRSILGMALLVVLAFTLGMNVERLAPWFQHAPTWLSHAHSWIEQGLSWLTQMLSWVQAAWHLAH